MILHLDCSSGIAGDMLAAALTDLLDATGGDGERVLRDGLAAAGIDGRAVRVERVSRNGFAARRLVVDERPGHESFALLLDAVEASSLPPATARAVGAAAQRMAAAEREVHGEQQTHLHELAGLDTMVDLVAVAALLAALMPERVTATPPALGGGVVTTAHGPLAVPVPAVLALLRGVRTAGTEAAGAGELTTPTGAALFAEFVDEVASLPAGVLRGVGVGAGERQDTGRPNVLRAVLVETVGAPAGAADEAHGGALEQLETNIDDATAEVLAHAAGELRVAGALDVWFTPALMKKGRPGQVLHVLCRRADTAHLAAVLFRETSTFGLRVTPVERLLLDERRETVKVPGGTVAVRLGFLDGSLVTASPEFGECSDLARRLGLPVKTVVVAAQAAAQSAFGGAPPPHR